MNIVRRIFGIVWLLLAPVALYFIVSSALGAFDRSDKAIATATNNIAKATTTIEKVAAEKEKVNTEAAKTNAILQWSIIIIIFLPIAFGLVIFGKYALAGEYNRNAAKSIA